MTSFALTLRWLTAEQAAAMAAAAIVLNWVILPLTGRDLRRPGEPFVDGVKLYPVAILALVTFLPLPSAAAAWGVLGVGDAASNVVGRRFGTPPFLGRADRSLAGTAAFVALGGGAALGRGSFAADLRPTLLAVAGSFAAAAAGALAEFVPRRLRVDDNVPIAIAAGGVLYLLG
jgi:dolichol kinase